MFGYVRPLKNELRVGEFERYRACYCALCHAIADGFGFPARFILNYDLLFLAMLIWPAGEEPRISPRRCPVSPVRGKPCCAPAESLSHTAACSVILSYWKLKDGVSDEGFPRAALSGAGAAALTMAYKRAENALPDFARTVKERLSSLDALEKAGETSLDCAADEFASLLAAASPETGDSPRAREIRQVLYHTGRWIYLIDAVNDLADDRERGRYNPVDRHFALTSSELPEEAEKSLRLTLGHSLGAVRSAFELMPETAWAGVIRNIIYLGMPAVTEAVFAGRFSDRPGGFPKY